MLMDQINDVLKWICLFVLLWNAYFIFFNKGIPNLGSAKAIRQKVVQEFINRLKSNDNMAPIIYDIGCGYGYVTRDLARAMPHAKIIGIEVNKISYWRAILTSKILGIKNTHYINKNFHDVDLSHADGLYMFLLGRLMLQIRTKIEKDLKKGTIVISNKFQINGDWQPIKKIDVTTIAPSQKTIYIYER
jgi:SAM-dependent methyltransferase